MQKFSLVITNCNNFTDAKISSYVYTDIFLEKGGNAVQVTCVHVHVHVHVLVDRIKLPIRLLHFKSV